MIINTEMAFVSVTLQLITGVQFLLVFVSSVNFLNKTLYWEETQHNARDFVLVNSETTRASKVKYSLDQVFDTFFQFHNKEVVRMNATAVDQSSEFTKQFVTTTETKAEINGSFRIISYSVNNFSTVRRMKTPELKTREEGRFVFTAPFKLATLQFVYNIIRLTAGALQEDINVKCEVKFSHLVLNASMASKPTCSPKLVQVLPQEIGDYHFVVSMADETLVEDYMIKDWITEHVLTEFTTVVYELTKCFVFSLKTFNICELLFP